MKKVILLLATLFLATLLMGCEDRKKPTLDIWGVDSEYNTPEDCEKASWAMKNNCYSNVAAKILDGDLCDKISDGTMKATCYTNVVEQTKDGALCERITKKTWKAACLQMSNNAPSMVDIE